MPALCEITALCHFCVVFLKYLKPLCNNIFSPIYQSILCINSMASLEDIPLKLTFVHFFVMQPRSFRKVVRLTRFTSIFQRLLIGLIIFCLYKNWNNMVLYLSFLIGFLVTCHREETLFVLIMFYQVRSLQLQEYPRGRLVGPLLFLVYINDISKCVTSTRMLLFADDTKLFLHIHSEKD
uniref:Putative reverse transcriptase n=1 Tax=Ixodes ricinus TaxID=34613 RepID=A0A147BBW7_IXORI